MLMPTAPSEVATHTTSPPGMRGPTPSSSLARPNRRALKSGANMLVNLTNDAWYGRSARAQPQRVSPANGACSRCQRRLNVDPLRQKVAEVKLTHPGRMA